jgi:hypothetical protein
MRRVVRVRLEMGRSVLAFQKAHMDLSPGSPAAVEALAATLTEAESVSVEQQEGMRRSRAATARKVGIRRDLNAMHLIHIARAGQAAAREVPKLEQVFEFTRGNLPYETFRTRALALAQSAGEHRELLVKDGLSEEMIQGLTDLVAQFDAAVVEGLEASRAHIGATARLEELSARVVELVGVMDGLNRYRFRNDRERLAEWENVSQVIDRAHVAGKEPAPPVPGSDVRPAA